MIAELAVMVLATYGAVSLWHDVRGHLNRRKRHKPV